MPSNVKEISELGTIIQRLEPNQPNGLLPLTKWLSDYLAPEADRSARIEVIQAYQPPFTFNSARMDLLMWSVLLGIPTFQAVLLFYKDLYHIDFWYEKTKEYMTFLLDLFNQQKNATQYLALLFQKFNQIALTEGLEPLIQLKCKILDYCQAAIEKRGLLYRFVLDQLTHYDFKQIFIGKIYFSEKQTEIEKYITERFFFIESFDRFVNTEGQDVDPFLQCVLRFYKDHHFFFSQWKEKLFLMTISSKNYLPLYEKALNIFSFLESFLKDTQHSNAPAFIQQRSEMFFYSSNNKENNVIIQRQSETVVKEFSVSNAYKVALECNNGQKINLTCFYNFSFKNRLEKHTVLSMLVKYEKTSFFNKLVGNAGLIEFIASDNMAPHHLLLSSILNVKNFPNRLFFLETLLRKYEQLMKNVGMLREKIIELLHDYCIFFLEKKSLSSFLKTFDFIPTEKMRFYHIMQFLSKTPMAREVRDVINYLQLLQGVLEQLKSRQDFSVLSYVLYWSSVRNIFGGLFHNDSHFQRIQEKMNSLAHQNVAIRNALDCVKELSILLQKNVSESKILSKVSFDTDKIKDAQPCSISSIEKGYKDMEQMFEAHNKAKKEEAEAFQKAYQALVNQGLFPNKEIKKELDNNNNNNNNNFGGNVFFKKNG